MSRVEELERTVSARAAVWDAVADYCETQMRALRYEHEIVGVLGGCGDEYRGVQVVELEAALAMVRDRRAALEAQASAERRLAEASDRLDKLTSELVAGLRA